MRLTERKRNTLTGAGLIAVVFGTRLPFLAHTLFEFDSVDFVVAVHRFSLQQVTPHMPGYILHILFGKLMMLFTSNENTAFVWISVLLSIGSVLFLWRAAYWLRGERVALIAALLWVTNPLFWFYGEVATVYPHEAFWASVLLYFGISLLRKPQEHWRAIVIAIVLSLATGTRQSSLLFFLPAILYLFRATRQSLSVWVAAIVVFCTVSACWMASLLYYSGGLDAYLHYASLEHIYRSQSILFGNPLREHAAVMVKIIVYLMVGSLALIPIVLLAVARFPRRVVQFGIEVLRKPLFVYTVLIAIVPLLFYFLVYFMKAGYLLNVLPSLMLIGAVLLDQCAIWLARAKKEKPGKGEILTRPIITRNAIILTTVFMLLNVLWFVAPLPGKSSEIFRDETSRESFNANLMARYPTGRAKRDAFLNKLFAYSSVQSVRAMDAVNDSVLTLIESERVNGVEPILLSTWWSRMAYFYKHFEDYDIQTIPNARLLVGRSGDWVRMAVLDSMIRLPRGSKALILIRHDHPDLGLLERQVHLRRLDAPSCIDLYEITDSSFSFTWNGVTFARD